MMKFYLLVFGFAVFLMGCATDSKYLVKKPYLYEVTKKNRKAYFFGSMHRGVDQGDLPEQFWKYIDESEILITEWDTKPDDEVTEINLLKPYVMAKDGESNFKEFLTQDEINRALKLISRRHPGKSIETLSAGLNDVSLFGFRWILQSNLEVYGEGQMDRGDVVRTNHKFMIDSQIQKYAERKKKYIDQLDERFKSEYLKCLRGTDQENMEIIRASIVREEVVHNFQEFSEMYQLYRDGKTPTDTYKTLPVCLLEGRNRQWLDKINFLVHNYQTPFFVVGVAHLIDDKGSLFDMLRAQSYQIRRIEELDLKPQ